MLVQCFISWLTSYWPFGYENASLHLLQETSQSTLHTAFQGTRADFDFPELFHSRPPFWPAKLAEIQRTPTGKALVENEYEINVSTSELSRGEGVCCLTVNERLYTPSLILDILGCFGLHSVPHAVETLENLLSALYISKDWLPCLFIETLTADHPQVRSTALSSFRCSTNRKALFTPPPM